MSFLYTLFLKLLYPTSLSLILFVSSAAFAKRKKLSRICFWLAAAILCVSGNGWLSWKLAQNLEWQYLPPDPMPQADCIVILSGGTLPCIPPRPTVEVTDAGDRVLYGAYLYRQGKAPRIICTGGLANAANRQRAYADDMADLLEMVGVPKESIIKEDKATDTHEHGRNLRPVLHDLGFKRVLLVTSAMHMPRSLGVFRRSCPGIEFIPAPTDFSVTKGISQPWYRQLMGMIPTPRNLLGFSEVMHEYLGIAWYKFRGWM